MVRWEMGGGGEGEEDGGVEGKVGCGEVGVRCG